MWETIESLIEAADQGDAKAQTELAECYRFGKGIEQDYIKAVEWYSKAAEQGVALAQRRLGVLYDLGQGVEQNTKKAFDLYKKAASQGDANAQYFLAEKYDDGKDVKQDYEKAFEWYKKSAEQGGALAQNTLGKCYAEGKGVKQDYVKAFEWYTKSAEQGYVPAQFNLSECFARGEGVEIDSEKADEWYKKADEKDHKCVVNLQKKATTQRFYNSIKNNNTEEVLKIINSGVNINKSLDIPSEYTPLMVAAKYDSKEVAELLIEHGAEVSESPIFLEDGSYYFPLSAAAEWNAKKVADVLVKHGAEIDTDNYGDAFMALRPIDYAIIHNSKDIVELFLNHDCELYYLREYVKRHDEEDDYDYDELENTDPIAYAEEHNFTELAELLKKRLKKS